MKLLFFFFISLFFLPLVEATGLGASPAQITWHDTEDKSILIFNPEPFPQVFAITPAKEGLLVFSETQGIIPAGETYRIHAHPVRMQSASTLIYISIQDHNAFFEPSLALHATITKCFFRECDPPPITGSLIGILGGLPAKAALVAFGTLLMVWGYLHLRKK